ncbi:MAG: MerR family transcriptional regulator [Maricaulis sp.]|jgi:DNA-binding transcriptional MerR regulator|nr:MerR family transcriptional regulator [Maricaulis sp.]HAQ35362.1 MerR family transcriptional regulator [Alphaproteobacteria bacterium]
MTDKGPDAYRTISEAAEELDLPAHVLRFWEGKFPQLRPVKRAGGRRFYRPGDIALLRGVKSLLYVDGYTIKGVQKFLRENGAAAATARGEEGQQRPVPKPIAEQYVQRRVTSAANQERAPDMLARLESAKAKLDAAIAASRAAE